MALFPKVDQPNSPPPTFFSLNNPTKLNPSIILMNNNETNTPIAPLFTHNCQIKNELVSLILNNGSQKNIVAQDLVQCFKLPTTPHLAPY